MNHQMLLFLKDLKQEIKVSPVSKKINSVIIFGSTLSKYWVKGLSDVDTFVIVNNRTCKKEVKSFLTDIFLQLNHKYSLGLEKSLLPSKNENCILSLFYQLDNFISDPIIIYSICEIESSLGKLGTIKGFLVRILFGSYDPFLYSIKMTGFTLYGDDHLSDLNIKDVTIFGEVRPLVAQCILSLLALVAAPILPDLSLRYCYLISRNEIEHFLYCNRISVHFDQKEKIFCQAFNSIQIENHLAYMQNIRKNCYDKANINIAFRTLIKTMKFLLFSQKRYFCL